MKYQYKKNSNKKIITKEKHEINDNTNKNKFANINIINLNRKRNFLKVA